MKIFSVLFTVLLISAGALAQSGTISGTVNFNNSGALHGVTVTLIQTRQNTQTDSEGKFSFTGLTPGRYTILTHLDGFSNATRIVDLTQTSDVNVTIVMQVISLTGEVTVTMSGEEQSIFDSFQSVNSVGSTRIMEKGAVSLGETLEDETGVAKRSFGPGSSRPVIRGFDGDRVLVLQDGLRSGSLGSQSADHGETTDTLVAERIEVIKGPATLLYGSNAIGGIVNVISHHSEIAHPGYSGFVSALGGTADRQGGIAGGLEYGFKSWMVRGNLGAQRTGDFDTPIGRIENSRTRSNSASFGSGYYGEKAFFGGNYSYNVRRYGVPFAGEFHGHHEHGHEGEEPHEHEELEIDIRQLRHNIRFNGGFRDLNNSFLSGMRYSIDYTRYKHNEIEIEHHGDHFHEDIATVFDNKIFSYRTLFEQQKYGRLTGRFGFEGHTRDYKVEGEEQLIEGNVKHNAFSVFGLEEVDLGRVRLQFGGRVENNRYRPSNPELRDRSFTAFSGGAGINIGLWQGGAFVVNYNHSNRAPALEELYNYGPHFGNLTFEIGDENLRRETANGIDFSLRHQTRRFRLTGDIYYYKIKDFIYFAYEDEHKHGHEDDDDEFELPVAHFEQSNAAYVGGEIKAEAVFHKYVNGFVSFDMVRARLTDLDMYVPRIPPAKARIGLDLRHSGFSLRPEAVFAADQNRVYENETRTPGYGIFNVAASYTYGTEHTAHIFSVNAYNLTNKLYRNHVNYIKDYMPEIGRGIRFGYTIRIF